jgi:hypothetical protein
MSQPAYTIAAAHVAPVFMDLESTVDKTCSIIREAAQNGAQLVAFPETFIPAFPVWLALRAPIHNHDLFCELAAHTMRADGPQMARIARTARECGIFVSIGFNEGVDRSTGTIFNSNALIGDDGKALNHHRRIVPTFYEKLVWPPGDGAGLHVVETRLGRGGMLICGENTNRSHGTRSLRRASRFISLRGRRSGHRTIPTGSAVTALKTASRFVAARTRSRASCSTSSCRRGSTKRRAIASQDWTKTPPGSSKVRRAAQRPIEFETSAPAEEPGGKR